MKTISFVWLSLICFCCYAQENLPTREWSVRAGIGATGVFTKYVLPTVGWGKQSVSFGIIAAGNNVNGGNPQLPGGYLGYRFYPDGKQGRMASFLTAQVFHTVRRPVIEATQHKLIVGGVTLGYGADYRLSPAVRLTSDVSMGAGWWRNWYPGVRTPSGSAGLSAMLQFGVLVNISALKT